MKCGCTAMLMQIAEKGQLVRYACKTWTCPRCGEVNRRRLIAKGVKGSPNKIITLTVNPVGFEGPDEAAQALVLAWRCARDNLVRYHGFDTIQFLAVFEEHKSGWPHLHILVRSKFIPQRWLSRYMRERINSPIVDIRKLHSAKHAARYVAKYVAKAPSRFQGCKRYWTSQNWAERPPKRQKDPRALWQIVNDAFAFMKFHGLDLAYEFESEGITPAFPWKHPERARPAAPP